jgi:Uma2 family endonuclease
MAAMNIALTRAADGLPRRVFNVSDIRRMVEAGVIGEDERVELIEGDLVTMAAKGYAHELIKNALTRAMISAAPDDVCVETTIQFADNVLLEPDLAVIRRHRLIRSRAGFATVDRDDCLLIIEVAASSLSYDRGPKAKLYAGLGVREYWVIDANERITWVHTGPTENGWSSILERGADETLTTPALPNFAVKLSEIA